MSEKLATKREYGADYAAMLVDLRPAVASVVRPEAFIEPEEMLAIHEALIATAEADYVRATATLTDMLFSEEIAHYGAQATQLFTQWEGEGGGPPLTAIVALAIEKFELNPESTLVRLAMMSALLAEFPNGLLYHGNEHYRKVLCHGIRLIVTHNNIFGGTHRTLQEDHIAKLLAAACIHDLGHMGGDNLKEGVYTPGYMEQRAFDISRPYFDALSPALEDIRDIETIVFCTDITFFAGDNSPCIRMKKIYKYYFWDDRKEDVSMMMMGKLRRFEDNPRLTLMAMILHEADVGTSAGLSYEQTVKETVNIMGERGVHAAGPRTVIAFLKEQLGETMFTEAAKQLFGPVMTQVIAAAEKDIAEGREMFKV